MITYHLEQDDRFAMIGDAASLTDCGVPYETPEDAGRVHAAIKLAHRKRLGRKPYATVEFRCYAVEDRLKRRLTREEHDAYCLGIANKVRWNE